MTTGTTSIDVSTPYIEGGVTHPLWYSGVKATKTWSGADWPIVYTLTSNKKVFYKWVKRGRERIREEHHVDIVRREARRAKSLAEHAYTMSYTEYQQALVRSNYNGAVYCWNWLFGPLDLNTNGMWTTNDELTLINKLNSQVSNSEFDASVALAGAAQTVEMLLSTTRKISRALHHARRGSIVKAFDVLAYDRSRSHDVARLRGYAYGGADATYRLARLNAVHLERLVRNPGYVLPPSLAAKLSRHNYNEIAHRLVKDGAASNWLALQYGLLPALDDIDQGMKFLAFSNALPAVKVYKATRQVKKSGSYWSYPLSATYTRQYRVTFSEPPITASYLNAGDVLSFAWEALPWSFVADWFIPVGDYLAARQAASRLNTGTIWRTDYIRSEGVVPQGTYGSPGYYVDRDNKFLKISVSRLQTTIVAPLPGFKPWGKSLSVGHLTNAVALLISRFT